MLSLAAPHWLLLLALLPAIRWLHRGGRHRRTFAVSRLALWREAASAAAAGAERRPPDPAWRRRALLAAVLALALAGPQWMREQRRVVLWVDDSFSMLTREAQGTRLATGLALARTRLADVNAAPVEVRTLGNPWKSLGEPGATTAATIAATVGRQSPAPPPAALLRHDARHWLLTDGAHAGLLAWPEGARAEERIAVGHETRNVGIERVAARRRPGAPARLDLLVRIANGGTQAETRSLVATDGDGVERLRMPVGVDPGAAAVSTITLPAASTLRLRLEPADALPEDDSIGLDLKPLARRGVALDPSCPLPLVRAVETHPGLAPKRPGDATLALDCGGNPGPGLPTLRVRTALPSQVPPQPLRWSSTLPDAGRPPLLAEPLRTGAPLEVGAGDRVWLAAGDAALIVDRGGAPRVVETAIDFGAVEGATGTPVPLLLNWLVERLLAEPVLDPVVVVDRGAAAARIVPSAANDSPAATGPPGTRLPADGSRALLLLAALVLLWEIVALALQWRRLATPIESR